VGKGLYAVAFDGANIWVNGDMTLELAQLTAEKTALSERMAPIKMGVLIGKRTYAFYGWMTTVCFGHRPLVRIPEHLIPFKGGFTPEALWLGFVFYQPGRLAGLGYCAILIMMVKVGFLRSLTSRLAAVGQTTFTNYILTAVICTTIFENYGFGLYGKLQR